MTLFSRAACAQSHRVRLVLAEKGITVDMVEVAEGEVPEQLLDVNSYGSVPTLVDRELVVYEPRIVMEYLDERFPHPPLMPVDPVTRARYRMALYRIERDWYGLAAELEGKSERKTAQIRKQLKEALIAANEVFSAKPYFLSDEFSLVDCTLAPLLWRLPKYGINLPDDAAAVTEYADRLFAREAFLESLTEAEMEIRGI